MIVAGIDPSLSNTAVCRGDGTSFDMQTFRTKSRGKLCKQRIDRALALAMDAAHFTSGVDVAFLEGYVPYSHNSQNALAEYGGLLRMWLIQAGIMVIEVPPATLKKFCAGKGNANKVVMATALVARYGETFGSDDEYDAFGLYRMACAYEGLAMPTNDHQRTALKTVRDKYQEGVESGNC